MEGDVHAASRETSAERRDGVGMAREEARMCEGGRIQIGTLTIMHVLPEGAPRNAGDAHR